MGDVLCFVHATSSRSRSAANSASKSADTPAALDRSSLSSGSHHSDGIELRRRHLKMASVVVPISRAKDARVGHRSMISRNEQIIGRYLGQRVLKYKAKSSQDSPNLLGHDVLMVRKPPRKEVRRGFIQRTREARIRCGYSQEQIAEILGMNQGTYKNYEINRPLPHELIPTFCEACEILPGELYGMLARRVSGKDKAG